MNLSTESTLITSLFFDDATGGTFADQAGILLNPEDFVDEGCRQVFRTVLKLRKENLPVDLCHAADAMIESGLKPDQAIPWLVDATNGAPLRLPGQIERYAEKIKAEARARKLTSTIGLAGERLQEGESIGFVKQNLIAEMEAIEAEKQRSEDKLIGEVVMPTLSAMVDRISGDDSKRGMQTGIAELDSATTGLNAGEFWICGAMPGRGKTAFSLQVAINLASSGFAVYFVSLEMSSAAIVRRLMKMKFGAYVVEHPSQAQWAQMLEYGAELKLLPFFINESAALEAAEIAQHSRIMVARNKINLIIVDYLQIVRGPGRDRRERTGDAANVLRSLAKDTGVPVLALSQLRRPDSLNDRPSMIELKESGDLEAHAHVVLLMHMPINEDGTFTGEEEIIIGKQREGPTGSIPVYFDRSKVTFRERRMEK